MTRFVLPECCVFCGGSTAGTICFDCRADLPRIVNPCERCHQPAGMTATDGVQCAECQLRPPPFERARSAVLYAFPIDAALKAFKFGHALYYVPAFTELLLACLVQHFPHADGLVPVPLHHWRYAMRGFNQALELCRPLSRSSGLPIVAGARRVRSTLPQSGLDKAARRRNLKGAFSAPARLRCRHPLIIDDVMTTGETCRQLATALLRAGATTVGVLTLARAAPGIKAPARARVTRAG